jgi:FtsH-binding integral membrane protein|tara:strand:+ start:96 stop:941 length:846 start_codon:yes stop_codon:yes gene_type:complete
MNEVLFFKTFSLVGGMLLITSIGARINKAYETTMEAVLTIGGTFLTLFIVYSLRDDFPSNLLALVAFSFCIGWSMGPTITMFGERFKFRKYSQKIGLKSKVVEKKKSFWGGKENKKTVFYYKDSPNKVFEYDSPELVKIRNQFKEEVLSIDKDPYSQKWQNNVFFAMVATTLSVFMTAAIVYFSDTDFGFLGSFLFFALLGLIIVRLLKAWVIKDSSFSMIQTGIGIVIFTFYLIYDFNRLEKAMAQGDESWGTAVDLAVSIYLDIVNLFLLILEAMAENN